jgi:hypothetical protein
MTFQEELVKAAVGPAITVVLGSVLVGSIAALYRQWDQDRRADQLLRRELIDQMTRVAGTLWMQCAVTERGGGDKPSLERQYVRCRVQGEVLERRLGLYFAEADPRRQWHAVMDLVTVRYFEVRGTEDKDFDVILDDNKRIDDGPQWHSGLSKVQLADTDLVAATYKERLGDAARLVMDASLRPTGSAFERLVRQHFVGLLLVTAAGVLVVTALLATTSFPQPI